MAERNSSRLLPASGPDSPLRLPHLPAALDHFSISILNDILADAATDFREAISTLVEISRTGKPMERIAAIRTLRDITRENAELNGYIATLTATSTTTPSSTTTQQQAAVRRLISQESPHDLARRSHAVVDLAPALSGTPAPAEPVNGAPAPAALPLRAAEPAPAVPDPSAGREHAEARLPA